VTDELVPRPPVGRVFETTRRVRVADADPSGRLRLDAVARFVQDVGNDDVGDAGLPVDVPWVVRRSVVRVEGWPQLGERVSIATWCGGTGSRWAERRVSFSTASGTIDVATLVVHLDAASGRPAKLPGWFEANYAEAAQGRTVTTRLSLPAPPEGAPSRPFAVRSTDFDVMGHVNNPVTWAAVEDECARRGVLPTSCTVEWLGPVDGDVELRSTDDGGIWLCDDGVVRVAASVS
jgi:acyl-ACP thioesterase